jgi:hypothetical protein
MRNDKEICRMLMRCIEILAYNNGGEIGRVLDMFFTGPAG